MLRNVLSQPIAKATVPCQQAMTQDLSKPSSAPSGGAATEPRPLLRAGWLSDPGRMRELNEDSLVAMSGEIEQGGRRQAFGLFVLADGMGGHEQGENASNLAARTVADELMRAILCPAMRGSPERIPLHQAVRGAVTQAHERLRQEVPGSGTTLTVGLIVNDLLAIGHVGDSRAYLFHDEETEQITRDHSLVARLVEMGQATAEEAAVDHRRNYLLRALGQSEALEVDFQFQPFAAGSKLLLCSDGLWGQINPADLDNHLRSAIDPQAVCQQLVDMANAAGGPDNISAICVIHS